MIKKLKQVAAADFAADVCIVGGGVAGITLALALEGKGARVLLLEGGGRGVDRNQQNLYEGTTHGLPARPLTESRIRCLGGTSARWYGRCVALEDHDFEYRAWVPASGWPFAKTVLEPYYRRAARVVGVRNPRTGDASLNQVATENLGTPRLVARWADIRMTHFGLRFRQRLAASKQVTVVLNAQVLRLKPRPSGGATSLVIAEPEGTRRTITVNRLVLAGGGIENPRLMLLSGLNEIWPTPDCPIGRYFMNHGYVEGAKITDYPLDVWRDYIMTDRRGAVAHVALEADLLRREQITGCAAYLLPKFAYQEDPTFNQHPLREVLEDLARGDGAAAAARLPRVVKSIPRSMRMLTSRALERRRPPRALVFRSVFEQTPNRGNRITLDAQTDSFGLPRPIVSWAMTDADARSVRRFYEIAEEDITAAGLGHFEPQFDFSSQSWTRSIYSARHHMGATRMGEDPETSVVDANCRVHGFDDLYVAGSSVFPTYGWANPTLTIIALALRLADHLAGQTHSRRTASI